MLVDLKANAEFHEYFSFSDDPFTQCHDAIPIGDRDGGPMKDCMMDVCMCFIDPVSETSIIS